jgi:hypothetical protein
MSNTGSKINCLVIVKGYTKGKFSSTHASFLQMLAVKPDVGDIVTLEPGSTWGTIQCVVEHCKVSEEMVRLYARLMTDADHDKLAEYGE